MKPTQKEVLKHFRYERSTGKLFRLVDPYAGRRINRESGWVDACGYLRVHCFGKAHLVHRLIFLMVTGSFPRGEGDHINGNRLDNPWKNLRDVSHFTGMRNTGIRITNKSGIVGVSWDAHNKKWRACIKHRGIQHCLGRFVEKTDATRVRRAAERRFRFHPNHGKRLTWRG